MSRGWKVENLWHAGYSRDQQKIRLKSRAENDSGRNDNYL